MKMKTFKRVKILTTSFVSATVAMAVVYNNIILALAGVLIGILFLSLVKRSTKEVLVDERVVQVSGYAARATFITTTILLAFLSIIFIGAGHQTGEIYVEMLGTILSYIALLSLAVYSIFYKYFEKKHGGD